MNVLRCDKTGTLTEGVARFHSALNLEGQESEEVPRYAYLNAFFETGLVNPIDEAIRTCRRFDFSGCRKLDEVPYDFIRQRLSIPVADKDRHVMVTKGALAEVLAVYSTAKTAGGADVPIAAVRDRIDTRFRDLSGQGFRTLGIAWRGVESASHVTRDQESAMVFAGLLVLWRARTHIGEDRATSGRRCTVVLGASCPDR